jgi:NADH dehydrogenase [ubiquinone] 1 alpha subcomplex assembly factor 1
MLTLSLLLTVWVLPVSPQPDSIVLVDFSRPTETDWFVVNDGVMGGVSSSTMSTTEVGTGVFAGRLSLENNGGFASVRTALTQTDLSHFAGLVLRVRGDGRRYEVRLRTDASFDGIAYRAEFDTRADTWTTVVLPFDTFVPTFRGYVPRNAPPLDPSVIRQLGLLIGDKREGPFRLEVERVIAVRDLPEGLQEP